MLERIRIALAPAEPPNIDRAVVAAWLSVAQREVGRGENGTGNNRGPDLDRYRMATGRPGGAGAWCAAFASYCVAEAVSEVNRARREIGEPAIRIPFPLSRSAKRFGSALAQVGRVLEVPEPGAWLIWYRPDPDGRFTWRRHIGCCETYDPDGDSVVSIEGNAGPLVRRRTRPDWRRRLALIVTL